MQITRNEDGTVTVSVPQAPETYDPATGGLFVSETVSAAEFRKATAAAPKKRPAKKSK